MFSLKNWRRGIWRHTDRHSMGRVRDPIGTPPPPPTTKHTHTHPRLYMVSFPIVTRLVECPMELCRGRALMRTKIRIHFLHHHMRDTIMILDKGNRPHPRCLNCDMIVPWAALNHHHHTTAI